MHQYLVYNLQYVNKKILKKAARSNHTGCYEEYQWIQDAIAREKQLKGGSEKEDRHHSSCKSGLDDLSGDWYD